MALASCPQCRALFRTAVARCPRDQVALVPVDVDPLVGTTLDERYHLEAVIGDGGSGRVYRARRWRSAARFAIKVPFGDLGADPRALQRLEREAEAMSRIDHPNLVGIIDRGVTARGLRYLAMPLVEGELLTDVIARGPLSPTRAIGLLAQMADGLAHAHERGLVHRDLKPDNILVETGPHGEVARVVDFGIVLLREGHWERLTAKGMVVGTPEYMSPEQLVDTNIGPASDLYSLGLVLYEMLVGDRPFTGTVAQVASKHLSDPLPALGHGAFGPFDPRLDVLLRWMTRKKVRDRVPSAAAVAGAARAIARSLTTYESGGAVTPVDDEVEVDGIRKRVRARRPSTVRRVRLEPSSPDHPPVERRIGPPASAPEHRPVSTTERRTIERRTITSVTERRAARRTSTRMRALPGPPSIAIPRLTPGPPAERFPTPTAAPLPADRFAPPPDAPLPADLLGPRVDRAGRPVAERPPDRRSAPAVPPVDRKSASAVPPVDRKSAPVVPPVDRKSAPAVPAVRVSLAPATPLIDPETADTLTLSRLYRQVGERLKLAGAAHGRPAELLARRYAAIAYLAAAARPSLRPGAVRELLALNTSLDDLDAR